MQLGIIILSEASQKEKNKYHTTFTYICNLKYGTKEPIHKAKIDSQTQRTDFWLPRGRGGEREGLEVWDEQTETDGQGPTAQRRELYSISCDKPSWKRIPF